MITAKLPELILKPGKDESLKRFHPWVFSGAVQKIVGNPAEGQLVKILSATGEFLCLAHYQIGSITARVISFLQEEINQDFWNKKIFYAYRFRRNIGLVENEHTNVYRLIHGEGDGLPGLVVDFYNGTAVMQMHSLGMYLERERIVEALRSVLGDSLKAVYNKSENTLPHKSDIQSKDSYLFGKPETRIVLENGLKFRVDWEQGQKTGFFIDQRDNRELLKQYCANKKVLNLFGYTGGFSVYALQGGASHVDTVDSSLPAMDITDENIRLNFSGKSHNSVVADAFDFLRDAGNQYDVMVLDPPAFAKHNNALKQALLGYKKLNTAGFRQIKPGGIIFTFSCSQIVSRYEFRKIVFTAAAIAKRKVRIIHQLGQPPDHPVNIYHPEGEYLKGLVLYVE